MEKMLKVGKVWVELDCMMDTPANWKVVCKLAAVITAISIISMVLKYVD